MRGRSAYVRARAHKPLTCGAGMSVGQIKQKVPRAAQRLGFELGSSRACVCAADQLGYGSERVQYRYAPKLNNPYAYRFVVLILAVQAGSNGIDQSNLSLWRVYPGAAPVGFAHGGAIAGDTPENKV